MTDNTFISTTIPYVNARPHLGHALEYVQADSYARHQLLQGRDVYFLSGSDENSLKNVLAAEQEGVSVRQLVDRNVTYFERLTGDLQLNLSRFIRTSVDADHIEGSIETWRRMEASGDIYLRDYQGLYCVGCEQFYNTGELVDGKCPEHLVEPELVTERNYFFRLSRYQDRLLAALEAGTFRIIPESRYNEVVSFIRAGLTDISISRSSGRAHGWGIPVPGDPGQVMYVWIDALTNYINALGWTRDDEDYQRYWVNAFRRTHLVGKGVTRFHAVYWPAMLMSAGLPIPTDVVVHGYITASGKKLSKSLGDTVDPAELIARFGANAVRYYLLADFSPFADGDFSEERLVQRYNADLANGLGNLFNRLTSMSVRYRDGVVTPSVRPDQPEWSLTETVTTSAQKAISAMEEYDHREALSRVWDAVRRTNAYTDERAPWQLAKRDDHESAEALDTTLLYLTAAVRQLGRLVWPFLPIAGEAILHALGTSPEAVPGEDRWLEGLAAVKLSRSPALFPRIEELVP